MYCRCQIRILLVSFFSMLVGQSTAQAANDDTTRLNKSIYNAVSLYYQSAGDQSRLYNGTRYPGYPFPFTEGTPFFLTDQEQQGSIIYDRMLYQDIILFYDELMDVIIFQDDKHRIQLLNEKISEFSISGHRFIRVLKDTLHTNAPVPGFYNSLYEGHIAVFKKERKTIRELSSFSADEKNHFVDTKVSYYLKKNNEYFEISSRKELLHVLKDRKSDIQRFIRTSKLNFKKDPDNLLAKVAGYYDHLANK